MTPVCMKPHGNTLDTQVPARVPSPPRPIAQVPSTPRAIAQVQSTPRPIAHVQSTSQSHSSGLGWLRTYVWHGDSDVGQHGQGAAVGPHRGPGHGPRGQLGHLVARGHRHTQQFSDGQHEARDVLDTGEKESFTSAFGITFQFG